MITLPHLLWHILEFMEEEKEYDDDIIAHERKKRNTRTNQRKAILLSLSADVEWRRRNAVVDESVVGDKL